MTDSRGRKGYPSVGVESAVAGKSFAARGAGRGREPIRFARGRTTSSNRERYYRCPGGASSRLSGGALSSGREAKNGIDLRERSAPVGRAGLLVRWSR